MQSLVWIFHRLLSSKFNLRHVATMQNKLPWSLQETWTICFILSAVAPLVFTFTEIIEISRWFLILVETNMAVSWKFRYYLLSGSPYFIPTQSTTPTPPPFHHNDRGSGTKIPFLIWEPSDILQVSIYLNTPDLTKNLHKGGIKNDFIFYNISYLLHFANLNELVNSNV